MICQSDKLFSWLIFFSAFLHKIAFVKRVMSIKIHQILGNMDYEY